MHAQTNIPCLISHINSISCTGHTYTPICIAYDQIFTCQYIAMTLLMPHQFYTKYMDLNAYLQLLISSNGLQLHINPSSFQSSQIAWNIDYIGSLSSIKGYAHRKWETRTNIQNSKFKNFSVISSLCLPICNALEGHFLFSRKQGK